MKETKEKIAKSIFFATTELHKAVKANQYATARVILKTADPNEANQVGTVIFLARGVYIKTPIR